MKRIILVVITVCLCFGCGSFGFIDLYDTGRDGDFYYEIGLNGISINGYRGGNEAVIPSTIKGRMVTSIGRSAFANKDLTSVEIPWTVEIIGERAFENNNLTSVDIPPSVTQIHYSVFYNNKLTSVTIREGTTTIFGWAFANNQLANVTIPASVRFINESAFVNNPLINITVDSNNASFTVKDFYLLSKDEKQLLLYYGSENNVVIPERVTRIDRYAFSNKQLTRVTLPKGLLVSENTIFGRRLYNLNFSNNDRIFLSSGNYELRNNQWYCNSTALQQPAQIVPGDGIYIKSIDDNSLNNIQNPIYLSPGFHRIEVGYSRTIGRSTTYSEGTVTFEYAFVLESGIYDFTGTIQGNQILFSYRRRQ